MTIKTLRKNLEERLQTLNNEYKEYDQPFKQDSSIYSCYEKNEINRLVILLELKGQIKEVERTLAYLETAEKIAE